MVCGLAGILFIAIFRTVKNKFFASIKLNVKVKPAIGMVFIGLSFILFPYAVGTGYGYVQQVINGVFTLSLILIFIVLKMFSTSFTVASGNSEGDFAPSLVIGGLIGGAFSIGIQSLSPSIIAQPAIFVVVAMGAFIAAIAKTPIAAIIIVSEMSASYTVLAPAILASVIAYVISQRWTLYENQLPDRTFSYAHISDMICDIFCHIEVRKIMSVDLLKVSVNRSVKAFEELIKGTVEKIFPVVNENDELIGLIETDKAVNVLAELKGNVKIGELYTDNYLTLYPNDNLRDALHKLIVSSYDRIPVVDPNNTKKIIGMVARRDIEKVMNL